MKHLLVTFYAVILSTFTMVAQNTEVKGRVVDANSNDAISDVEINIQGSVLSAVTDDLGLFSITGTALPQGEQVLIVGKADYVAQRIPITISNGAIVNLDPILLQLDLAEVEAQIGVISLSDNELNQDEGTSFNISGLLQASRDTFLNAAAFDFSATFFRPRGLDNANGKVLINGIEMNKQFSGRPQWGNWGGLNDVQRNREFTMGIKANEYTFGDIAGTTNIIMRASQYRQGARVSYAMANRSYEGRVMGTYNSGLTADGWAYSFSLARRFGNEGYIDGTLYDANSFFASVEKKLNDDHSVNLTAFYTPNRRGRSTAITQEVRDLKGIRYNPNWGYQDGELRNSRIRKVQEPIITLNHYWNISEKTRLNTNLGYQFGNIGNSRIDNGGQRNPFGNYYQRLPSYFLRDASPTTYDYQQAYLAEQQFINDGQINWSNLYSTNLNATGPTSYYTLQEDRNDDTQLSLNSILSTTVTDNIEVNASLNYRSLKSENYARVLDLLGGSGVQDVDAFADERIVSDLQNPNFVAQEGDRYRYNYEIDADVVSGFAQAQFKYNKIDFFLGANVSQTSYQRTGLFQNGYFPEEGRSLGASEKVDFSNYGFKGGLVYKVTGRHLIDFNAGYLTKAPTIRSTFANARQNNDIVDGLTSEKIQSADLSYIYRSPIIKARLTGYYAGFSDATDIGFFFNENTLVINAQGEVNNNAFVQEIVQGIEKRNVGLEMGIEAQVLPTVKLKAAATVGQNLYTNNPNVYYASDDLDNPATEIWEGNDLFRNGKRTVYLENYHVAGGPERAYQIGLEYRDPDFWWVGMTTNYFSNAYVDVSNIRRIDNFALDEDGQPFSNYDPELARELLTQEELDDYFLVNIVGGKSWKVNQYYIGFFATINNVLNQNYRTGGFEDSRLSSFTQQVEEQGRENGPLFGNRYFFGNGTTYYLNVYVRF